MRRTLREIALLVGGRVHGPELTEISGLATLQDARPGDLTFLADPRFLADLKRTQATAVLLSASIQTEPSIPFIRVPDANEAMIQLSEMVLRELTPRRTGRHATAVLERAVTLGKQTYLGPWTYVGDGVRIGDGSQLLGHIYVGRRSSIGKDCVIHPNVVIGDRCTLGDRVVLHPGVVIGGDGFGYIQTEGRHRKIPQIGTVTIEDDVEIGANSSVDRARLGTTRIGRGTKIDSHVHVGHGVRIGEHCIIVAQVGLGGSSTLGDRVVVGGQAGISDHTAVGSGSRIGSRAAVFRDIPDGAHVSGFPAHEHMHHLRELAALKRLPHLLERMRKLAEGPS